MVHRTADGTGVRRLHLARPSGHPKRPWPQSALTERFFEAGMKWGRLKNRPDARGRASAGAPTRDPDAQALSFSKPRCGGALYRLTTILRFARQL